MTWETFIGLLIGIPVGIAITAVAFAFAVWWLRKIVAADLEAEDHDI